MKEYFTENEMLKREQLFALVCIGGMAEGFDYSDAKRLMNFWSDKRRECGYHGGFVEKPQARASAA